MNDIVSVAHGDSCASHVQILHKNGRCFCQCFDCSSTDVFCIAGSWLPQSTHCFCLVSATHRFCLVSATHRFCLVSATPCFCLVSAIHYSCLYSAPSNFQYRLPAIYFFILSFITLASLLVAV